MCGIIKPRPNEVIISNNFQALEEAIDEIQETENIRNEKEFFDLYRIKIMKLDQQLQSITVEFKFKNIKGAHKMLEQEIDGVTHVLVPKEMWDRMWEVFDRIDKLGEQT